MENKTIYVIGKVTGVEADNRPEFERVRARLKEALGCNVEIPHDTIPAGTGWADAMRQSLSRLVAADGVAMLADWSESQGAMLEFEIASAMAVRGLTEVRVWWQWIDTEAEAA